MSVKATDAVWDYSQASRGSLNLMLALADWADDCGYVIYRKRSERTLQAIGRKARLDKRSVIDIITRLEAAGELQVDRGGAGAGDVHEYRITLPGLETAEEKAAGLAAGETGENAAPDQDMGPAAGTDGEPGQDVAAKGEVSSPLPQAAEKGEVSSNKGEVPADKGEVSSAHIRNNHSTISPPPYPQNQNPDAAAAGLPLTGQAAAAAEPPPSEPIEMQRLKSALLAREGEAAFASLWADLKLAGIAAHADPDKPPILTLSTVGEAKRDLLDQRKYGVVISLWGAVNGPISALNFVTRPDERPARYSIEEQAAPPKPAKQSSRRGRKRRAA